MGNCNQQHSASRTALQAVGMVFIALLTWALLTDNAHAETPGADWLVSVPLYLTAGAYFASTDTGTDVASSVNASAELLLSSPSRRYDVALFLDYRFSRNREFNGVVHLGSSVQVYSGRWDTTAYIFNKKAPSSDDAWGYAGRIRYAFAANHKLGLEVFAALQEASDINLSLGYYGEISDALSIKVVAGSNARSGNQRFARTELVWQFN